jgi:hypothetical protein
MRIRGLTYEEHLDKLCRPVDDYYMSFTAYETVGAAIMNTSAYAKVSFEHTEQA